MERGVYRKPDIVIYRKSSWANWETHIYSHIDIGISGKPNIGTY